MQSSNDLNYNVSLKVNVDHLRYVIRGERSVQSTLAMWKRIYQDCRHYGIYKVYATVLLSGQINKMEIPLLINQLIAINSSTEITCAWVDHNFQSFQDNLIGERIPRPAQMNIRIFNNEVDAMQWLSQN